MRSLRRALLLASVAGLWFSCSVNQAGLTDDGGVHPDGAMGTAGSGATAGRGGSGGASGAAGTIVTGTAGTGGTPTGTAGAGATAGATAGSNGRGGMGGTGGSNNSGAAGAAGESGAAGDGGAAGNAAGAGGNNGTAGDSGTAGTGEAGGTTGSAGAAGIAGAAGTIGTAGAGGMAGANGGRGGSGFLGQAGRGGTAGGQAGRGGTNGRGGTGGNPCATFPSGAKAFVTPTDGKTHCYWARSSSQTWSEAQQSCTLQNGHLVTILSAEENAFVVSIAQFSTTFSDTWIGATDGKMGADKSGAGTYKWVTNEAWGYSNWQQGQPDGYCDPCSGLMMCTCDHRAVLANDGTWNDRWQDNSRSSVCEATAN